MPSTCDFIHLLCGHDGGLSIKLAIIFMCLCTGCVRLCIRLNCSLFLCVYVLGVFVSASVQSSAVCMLDDAIEFGGDAAHKYIPQCLEVFLRGMSSPHTVLRQSR